MKLKHLLWLGVICAGLLLASCVAEIPLEDEATAATTKENLKRIMNYQDDGAAWLPIRVDDNFIWGITGHPIETLEYSMNDTDDISLKKQLDYVKELGMTYYRVPIDINNNLTITNQQRLDKLIIAAQQKGIKLLPGVLNNEIYANWNTWNGITAYTKGKNVANYFVTAYKDNFDYYEIGNELDNPPVMNNGDGDDPLHYNQANLNLVANFYRGMIERIRLLDPTAKIIINSSWVHTYYHTYIINHLAQYNLTYDIIGLHWYSKDGKLMDIAGSRGKVTDFGKYGQFSQDIWITEINRQYGSSSIPTINNYGDLNNADKNIEQSNWIQSYMRELDAHNGNKIKAFFVYELYDEPLKAPDEQFGLLKWQTQFTTAVKKPAFTTSKFFIEETKNGYTSFIKKLYRVLNNNNIPGNSQVTSWENILKGNRNKYNTAGEFMKEVYFSRFVDKLFLDFENTSNPSASAKTYWVDRMKNGYNREGAITDFCHGTTFYNLAGGTNEGFVQRLYTKLLGRTPAINSWEITDKANAMNQGIATKGMIIQSILQSQEYYTKFVKEQYLTLLQRNVTANDGLDFWTGQMNNGMQQLDVIKRLISQNEFWERCILDGYQLRTGTPL